MELAPMSVTCPRCGSAVEQRFYGPCAGCVDELFAKFSGEARDDVVAEEYVPKMNVVPNAIASKD